MGDERFLLEATRAHVIRYARLAAWDVERDTLGRASWEGVFVAAGAELPVLRFAARRRTGDSFTSFALPIELEGPDALRRSAISDLFQERELAGRELPHMKKGGVVLEAATRVWDGGLNRESFDGVTGAFLELMDAVREALRRPSG